MALQLLTWHINNKELNWIIIDIFIINFVRLVTVEHSDILPRNPDNSPITNRVCVEDYLSNGMWRRVVW
jgi:hypothetical protein